MSSKTNFSLIYNYNYDIGIDYDLCKDNHPCKNGGICNKTDDWFTCNCNSGYGGELCNERIQTGILLI